VAGEGPGGVSLRAAEAAEMNVFDRYKINKALKAVSDYDLDDILERVGLERRSIGADIAADLGFFALGCLAGALVGVFFAPSKGAELRQSMKKAINEKGIMGLGEIRQGMGTQA
jgi:hypothetical protein